MGELYEAGVAPSVPPKRENVHSAPTWVRVRVRVRDRVRVRARGRARDRVRVRAAERADLGVLYLPISPYISLYLPTSHLGVRREVGAAHVE